MMLWLSLEMSVTAWQRLTTSFRARLSRYFVKHQQDPHNKGMKLCVRKQIERTVLMQFRVQALACIG